MATIIRCDGGCERESPHNGGHIANTWIRVKSGVARAFNQDYDTSAVTERIFCDACWSRVEAAMRAGTPHLDRPAFQRSEAQ